MMPGMPERRTHDYARHGVTSLFAAFNIAYGTVISELHRRRHQEFLKKIDKNVPARLGVHLVCDNHGTYKPRRPRTGWPDTPLPRPLQPDGIVVDQPGRAEHWFGYLTDQKIRRGVHKSVEALEADTASGSSTGKKTRSRSPASRQLRRSLLSGRIFVEVFRRSTLVCRGWVRFRELVVTAWYCSAHEPTESITSCRHTSFSI
jgi:hypothetical protein